MTSTPSRTIRPVTGLAAAGRHASVRVWIARAVLLVAAVLTGCAPAARDDAIRLMTWNIAAGFGDLDRIADVIRSSQPDIVALQEVDVHWHARSNFVDQATRLGEVLGMHVRFGRIYQFPGDDGQPPREFGLAILSRYPIIEFTNHVIPRLSTQSADSLPQPMPGFLEMVVDAGDVRVHVFDTHLDYRPDPRVRVQQVAAMLEIMDTVSAPTILMGDLNATPDAPELAPLLGRLHDAWRAGDDPGHTYPGDAPVRRIDFILLSDHFSVIDRRVLPVDASDHRPVIADVQIVR